jgi:hypothetical protein
MTARSGFIAGLGAVLLLSACAPETPELMNLRSSTGGPDEFAILPPKSLELPENLAALPPPTPGGSNLTDRDPAGDAILALGGKPSTPGEGYPAADAGLVAFANRFGTPSSNIRAQLAAEDLEWRRTHQGLLLQRWFNLNVYYQAYLPLALNPYAELQVWRAAGVATPSAPPKTSRK